MNTLKTFLFDRFNTLFPLFALTVLSILLLSIRLKLTHSFFYLFLVWNLFLAMIPFFISLYLKTSEGIKKYKLYFLLVVWLLFLPNAPYLLTDFIHLRLSPVEWMAYDGFMITAFAIAGLAFYVCSLRDIFKILNDTFKKATASKIMTILPFLVSFGMYLGRFLRWNSWDILHRPFHLLTDVSNLLFAPIENSAAWLFIIPIGFFLKLLYWAFEKFIGSK